MPIASKIGNLALSKIGLGLGLKTRACSLPNLLIPSTRCIHLKSQVPVSKPTGVTKCTVIPGDGIGPEITDSMMQIIKASGAPIEFETFFLSDIHPSFSAKLEDVVDSIKKNKICVKGIMANPVTGEDSSLNFRFRNSLGLFGNVLHIHSLPGVVTRHQNVDLIVVREQTEGEFSSLEHSPVPGVVECLKIVTEVGSNRIAKFAFDYATKFERKKVTAVHKANIMKLGDGLFLSCCKEIAKLYPKIKFESMIIDNCTMQLASNPHQFDVMVMGNLYGAIIDNLGSGLIGGAGIVPGCTFSEDYVVFEPGVRHTFQDLVGLNIANPIAMILCGVEMLYHVNLQFHANMIQNAVYKIVKKGNVRTKDIGGQSSTTDFTYEVISNLELERKK